MSKRYGLVFDLDRCTGCLGCIVACKSENNLEKGSGIRVDTIGGAHPDTPKGKYPNLSMYHLPVPCMHCDDPPCMDACPEEAIYKRQDGIVLVDEEKCTRCQVCSDACPYNVITHNPDKDVVWKCTLCQHRIDQELEPFCVICCEDEAMFFGDINDPESEISRLIAKKDAHALKLEAGTKPAVYYCPEVSRVGA